MFLLIYITHPDRDCAQRITDALLQDKLIACANVFPIESAYWWQGNIERGGEIVSLDNKIANGIMLEIGLGFRMTTRKVVDYELKKY